MALQTLNQGTQYGNEHIIVEGNTISFTIQDGPIKEHGVNGCQVVDLIKVSHHIISKLNNLYPCEENSRTIRNLADALQAQEDRTKNREARGVEGFNKK